MIETKKELDFYLKADLMMNRGTFKKSLKDSLKNMIVPDYIIEYLRCFRKAEYYKNCRGGGYGNIFMSINCQSWKLNLVFQ